MRERVLSGGFDLTAVLAQLGRNVVEVQRVINVGFGRGSHDLVVLKTEQGILTQAEAALDGALAQADVVVLRAGEVLQCGAVAGARQQAHVDLEIVAQGEADLVLALGQQLVNEGQSGHMLHGGSDHIGLAGRAGDEQIEVAYRLLAAAQGTRGRDGLDPGKLADELADPFGMLAGRVDTKA